MLLGCKPSREDRFDNKCARQFLGDTGRLLFRRPLTNEELASYVQIADGATQKSANFYVGLETSLANLLIAPQFLFRQETSVGLPDSQGFYQIDGYSKASRLSFLLWNTTPDDELLEAARRGDLDSQKGLERQIDRLLQSPRLVNGVRAFFVDMLGFDDFSTLSKDTTLYPKFTVQAAADIPEQTLRTIIDHLITRDEDYRDLLTTRHTFLTPSLASLYGMPLALTDENGAPDQWQPVDYPQNDPRAGLLAQASFVALHSNPGRTSPTSRGKALREVLLCEKVPAPPANVNFKIVQDTSNPIYKTARQRLTAHRTNPVCAGCHRITDPAGLALETFDTAGSYRMQENGIPIDTSGSWNGVDFKNGTEMARAIRNDPALPSCLVKRLYEYGTGREPQSDDDLKSLQHAFAADNYRFSALLKRITTDKWFYLVTPRQLDAPPSVAER
jgi:hypothetical protein